MAIKPNNMAPETDGQVNQKMRKGGPMNYVLFFLVLGMVLYGVFLSFDKGRILANTTDLEKQTRDLQAQIDTIKSNKVEVSKNASDALTAIETDEIRWSEVISEVEKLLPLDSSGRRDVEIMSYSGSGQGKITLSMVTQPVALPPYDKVARIISAFNSSVFFKDAYVPSISKGTDETGAVSLSFMLNTDYQKPETGSESLQVTATGESGNVAATANTPKIPRNNQ
jgi:hypothetical protein